MLFLYNTQKEEPEVHPSKIFLSLTRKQKDKQVVKEPVAEYLKMPQEEFSATDESISRAEIIEMQTSRMDTWTQLKGNGGWSKLGD